MCVLLYIYILYFTSISKFINKCNSAIVKLPHSQSKPGTLTQSGQTTTPPNGHKALGLSRYD